MDRRSFIKFLGLATSCAIINPIFPVSTISQTTTPVRRYAYMKISNEMLYDTEALKWFIQEYGTELSNNDPQWEKCTNIIIGFNDDDFIRNCRTVRLEYTGLNPPRIRQSHEELKGKYKALLNKDSTGNYL